MSSPTGISRRTFLGSAAGSLALPLLAPAASFERVLPSNRITLAFLGAGGRGSYLMRWFLRHADAQIVAVCDPFRGRQVEAKRVLDEKYGGDVVRTYTDFREVLARKDIDAVVIATPDHWHVPLAIAAARAGKDMYVEKPLGVSMQWAWELRRVMKRYQRVFQYGTQQRSNRAFRFACELARNGRLGELERIEAWCPDISEQFGAFHVKRYGSTEPVPPPEGFDYDLWLGPAPKVPYTVDRCTCFGAYHIYDYALGFIAGWGAHPLDIAQWGKGADGTSPVHYEGRGTIPTRGLYDTIARWDVHCRYADGLPLRFMSERVAKEIVSKYRPWVSHGTTFFGTKGWASVDRGGLHTSDPALKKIEFGPQEVHLYESAAHERNFLDCIKNRKTTISPLETAIRSDTISHLSDIAIRSGRAIDWDPEKEQILGDEAATRMLRRPLRAPWSLRMD